MQLQEAFAAGLIKPGLNRVGRKVERVHVNNVQGLNQKLSELSNGLPWIERLDGCNGPAPLAPELALKESRSQKEGEKRSALKRSRKGLDSVKEDPVHNDFKREMMFYRQAQATVLAALPRLRAMNVPTKRPEDYFAQMAKTDQHMQKVTNLLL